MGDKCRMAVPVEPAAPEAAAPPETTESAGLGRDAILAAPDCKVAAFPVPEWGGVVYVRVINGEERETLEDLITERPKDRHDIRARFAVMVLCDEAGKQLFSLADIAELNKKSGAALDRIFDFARDLNAMLPESVEGHEKNSDAGQSDASGSA